MFPSSSRCPFAALLGLVLVALVCGGSLVTDLADGEDTQACLLQLPRVDQSSIDIDSNSSMISRPCPGAGTGSQARKGSQQLVAAAGVNYWQDVATAGGKLDWTILDKKMKELLGDSWSGTGSKIGLGTSSVIGTIALAAGGDWNGALKSIAAGIFAVVGVENPLVGLIGGILLSFWPNTQSDVGADFEKFYKQIMDEVKNLISSNNAKLMHFGSQKGLNVVRDVLTKSFKPSLWDEAEPGYKERQEEVWDLLDHEMDDQFYDVFGIMCSGADDGSLDTSSKDCQEFFKSGVFVSQLAYASLHLQANIQLIALRDSDQRRAEQVDDVRTTAKRYARALTDSLEAWGKHGAEDVKCEYTGFRDVEMKDGEIITHRSIKNASNYFPLAGVWISDVMRCPWQMHFDSTCVSTVVIAADIPDVRVSDPMVCSWMEWDLCYRAPLPSSGQGAKCKDDRPGPSFGVVETWSGECSVTSGENTCAEVDFKYFREEQYPFMVHQEYDDDVKALQDLADNFPPACVEIGDDVYEPDRYLLPAPVPCCSNKATAVTGSDGVVRCQTTG